MSIELKHNFYICPVLKSLRSYENECRLAVKFQDENDRILIRNIKKVLILLLIHRQQDLKDIEMRRILFSEVKGPH